MIPKGKRQLSRNVLNKIAKVLKTLSSSLELFGQTA